MGGIGERRIPATPFPAQVIVLRIALRCLDMYEVDGSQAVVGAARDTAAVWAAAHAMADRRAAEQGLGVPRNQGLWRKDVVAFWAYQCIAVDFLVVLPVDSEDVQREHAIQDRNSYMCCSKE